MSQWFLKVAQIRPTIALKVLLATLCLTPHIHLPKTGEGKWVTSIDYSPAVCCPSFARVCLFLPVCARVQGCSAGCLARWRLGEPAPVAPPGGRSADHRLQVLEVRSQAVEPKQPQVFRRPIWTWLLCENSGKRRRERWRGVVAVVICDLDRRVEMGSGVDDGWEILWKGIVTKKQQRSPGGWGRGGENGLEAVGGPALKVISLMPCSYDCLPTFDCWQWTEGLLHIEWVREGGGGEGLRQTKKGWREGYVYSGQILPLIRLV